MLTFVLKHTVKWDHSGRYYQIIVIWNMNSGRADGKSFVVLPYLCLLCQAPKHQRVSAALSELFRNELRKINCQDCKVYQPIDYKVDDTTVIQPDLLVVCKPIEAHYLTFAPDVVVEILSPSTALKDRHTKFDIYQHEGVKYYIIIDPDEELFEIYELTAGKYTKKEYAEIMLEDCRFSLDLKACFD